MIKTVAIVGATGNVGREVLSVLADREFPVDHVVPLASRKSIGRDISFGDKRVRVQSLEDYDFSSCDMAIFAAGSGIAEVYAPKAASRGCLVIDNSSYFRMAQDVPLIIPEVNPDAVLKCRERNIIANPNCSTIQLLVVLAPLHRKSTIRRVIVSTYQSVSGAGKQAIDELWEQTKSMYAPSKRVPPECFTKQIAFNVIPQIDVFQEDGSTKEEWKMVSETSRILDKDIKLHATCVRVPVFYGHSEAVNIEFTDTMSPDEVYDILDNAPGCTVVDNPKNVYDGYVTPVDVRGEYDTYVSRIRRDPTVENGIALWVVADNLLKGAALNAVQIAELAIERGIL